MAVVKISVNKEKHIFCSVNVAAVQLGVTTPSLNEWIRSHEFPKTKEGVDLAALIAARKQVMQKDISDSARKLKAEADYKQAKARQEEMVALQMSGELIPAENVKDKLENEYLDIRQHLLTIPTKIKSAIIVVDPSIAGQCAREAENVVDETLRILGNTDGNRPTGVGEKPKRRYKSRKKGVSAAAAGNGE